MITLLAIVAAVGWLTCAYGWHRATLPAPDAGQRCRCAIEPIGRTTTDDGGRW